MNERKIELQEIAKQRDDAQAEAARFREALEDIAQDLGHPGDPAWRRAMEALGLDADGAEAAWHD